MVSKFGLENRVAIVTGSGRGIGRGIALGFAEAGAHVVVAGLNHNSSIEAVADEVRSLGRESLPVVTDVRDSKQVANMVDAAMAKFGRIDILVNNAGGGGLVTPVVEMTEEYWDSIIRLNLTSAFLCCKAVGRIMVNQKRGNIINIASATGQRPRPGSAAYSTAKAGLINFTMSLAAEMARYHIRVNTISPGPISTHETSEAARQERADRSGILLGRMGQPADIATAAIYLASDASDFVTGIVIDVRGGPIFRQVDLDTFIAKFPTL